MAKEPYKRDHILQKRPIILRSTLCHLLSIARRKYPEFSSSRNESVSERTRNSVYTRERSTLCHVLREHVLREHVLREHVLSGAHRACPVFSSSHRECVRERRVYMRGRDRHSAIFSQLLNESVPCCLPHTTRVYRREESVYARERSTLCGVATMSRLLKVIVLFGKRAL